jgi:hypothetical protein
MASSSLGRLALRRIAVKREPERFVPPEGIPWSRGLWGLFLPERRGSAEPPPPGQPERRASPTA